MTDFSSDNDLLNAHQVARYFGVTPRTLRTWTREGDVLPPIHIGRQRYWLKTDLEAWLKARSEEAAGRVPHPRKTSLSIRRGRPRHPVHPTQPH